MNGAAIVFQDELHDKPLLNITFSLDIGVYSSTVILVSNCMHEQACRIQLYVLSWHKLIIHVKGM